MKYYLIAGEASGDIHGSKLMEDIKIYDNQAIFRYWGGDKMKSQGGKLVRHFKNHSFMGFWEVFKNLITIINNLRFCKEDIRLFNPDIIIYIDYPGFNLKIAKWAKNNNFKNIFYISPQIWAWKENRIKSIKRDIDKMFVILPFEKKYYKKIHNYEVTYTGNPLVEIINNVKKIKSSDFLLKHNINKEKKIIALLPGSRKQEISVMLPTFIKVSKEFIKYRFIIAGAPGISKNYYKKIIKNHDIKIIFDKTYDILKISDAAIVTSGTATLETALFNVPQIVCYKSSSLTYFIAKKIIKLKYISLVNLIMNKKIVSEIIQKDFKTDIIMTELRSILNGEIRERQLLNYSILKKKLTDFEKNETIGEKIVNFLK